MPFLFYLPVTAWSTKLPRHSIEKNAQSLIFLELNEVNFDYVRRYVARGRLQTLARLIERHGVVETTSETRYEHLEPWIQWVTAHTGRTFAEHGIFRLGDMVQSDAQQIWERLEAAGITVGAVSPINGVNRTRAAAFFVPDPWTATPVSGSWFLRKLHAAIVQAVGDNASGKVTVPTLFKLLAGMAAHLRPSSIGSLAGYALASRRKEWMRSLFLDRLLADVFLVQWGRTRPGFSSLFLNAAAHIQHHYMFSSSVYDGPHRNPEWYLAPGLDPLLEVYELYDRIVADVLELPGAPRVVLATGLHQDPYPEELFYYRLRDHAGFLRRLGLTFDSVLARMSRDFTIYCASEADAAKCADVLSRLRAPDGDVLFSVDNRGRDLFVMLTYPREVHAEFPVTFDGRRVTNLYKEVVFVALKNGEHNGIGYLVDTGAPGDAATSPLPLHRLFDLLCNAVGVSPAGPVAKADRRAA